MFRSASLIRTCLLTFTLILAGGQAPVLAADVDAQIASLQQALADIEQELKTYSDRNSSAVEQKISDVQEQLKTLQTSQAGNPNIESRLQRVENELLRLQQRATQLPATPTAGTASLSRNIICEFERYRDSNTEEERAHDGITYIQSPPLPTAAEALNAGCSLCAPYDSRTLERFLPTQYREVNICAPLGCYWESNGSPVDTLNVILPLTPPECRNPTTAIRMEKARAAAEAFNQAKARANEAKATWTPKFSPQK